MQLNYLGFWVKENKIVLIRLGFNFGRLKGKPVL